MKSHLTPHVSLSQVLYTNIIMRIVSLVTCTGLRSLAMRISERSSGHCDGGCQEGKQEWKHHLQTGAPQAFLHKLPLVQPTTIMADSILSDVDSGFETYKYHHNAIRWHKSQDWWSVAPFTKSRVRGWHRQQVLPLCRWGRDVSP